MTEMERKGVQIEGVGVEAEEKLAEEFKKFETNKKPSVFMNLWNQSGKELSLSDHHPYWEGQDVYHPLKLEDGNSYGAACIASEPEGIKFGFVYADGDDSLSREFLAAVFLPLPLLPPTNAKVYVESGPISSPIDWNVVEVKLDMATSNSAEYDDPIFKGRVEARITQDGILVIRFKTNN